MWRIEIEPIYASDPRWAEDKEWVKQYLETNLQDGSVPDEELADLAYEHALAEMEQGRIAFASLTTKASDLIRLQAAIVGTFLAVWRYSSNPQQSLLISDFFAACAIVIFIAAMFLVATCLRGIPFLPQTETKILLGWSKDEKKPHVKMRAAVQMVRRITANNIINQWLSKRLSHGWFLTIVGLTSLAVSVVLRLFWA